MFTIVSRGAHNSPRVCCFFVPPMHSMSTNLSTISDLAKNVLEKVGLCASNPPRGKYAIVR